jgi:F-type H+-transporting ATPase subunit a
MSEHIIWLTVLVNRLFGKPAAALLAALHIQPSNPQYPIPTHVCMELFVFLLVAIFFLWLRSRISVENPGVSQQLMEGLLTNPMGVGARDLLQESVGHNSDKYLPMIGSIGMFVLFCNLSSLTPSLEAPTTSISVPLGCAIVVFLYYNWCGIVHHGPLRYGRQFLGPILIMSPLMVLVEIASHLARLLSLTVRLWVNMLVSDLLYVLFLGMFLAVFEFMGHKVPVVGYLSGMGPIFTIAFLLLHIFVAFLQAFVFTILPVIYLSGAVAEEH